MSGHLVNTCPSQSRRDDTVWNGAHGGAVGVAVKAKCPEPRVTVRRLTPAFPTLTRSTRRNTLAAEREKVDGQRNGPAQREAADRTPARRTPARRTLCRERAHGSRGDPRPRRDRKRPGTRRKHGGPRPPTRRPPVSPPSRRSRRAARAALTHTRALTGELRRALERLEVAISADPNAPSFGTLMARALPCGPWPIMPPSTQPWVMHHQSPGSNTWDDAAPNLP